MTPLCRRAFRYSRWLCRGQTAIKTGASKALAAAVAPIVQPAEFIAAPKEPQPEGAPAPDAALGAAVAGQPQPEAALAPKDAEYYKLAAEAQAQQVRWLVKTTACRHPRAEQLRGARRCQR